VQRGIWFKAAGDEPWPWDGRSRRRAIAASSAREGEKVRNVLRENLCQKSENLVPNAFFVVDQSASNIGVQRAVFFGEKSRSLIFNQPEVE